MSLIDNFYKDFNIHFAIEFSTSFCFPKQVDGITIKRKGLWQYELQFSHSQYDLVGLLSKLEFLKNDQNDNSHQRKCIFPDIFNISFYRHYYSLQWKPAKSFCPLSPLYFDTKMFPKNTLYTMYEKIYKPMSIQFSTFLCGLEILAYFEITEKPYCKIQIINYLPWINGRNKIFSDVQIISRNNFQDIVLQLQKNRLTPERLFEIYQKYDFLSQIMPYGPKEFPSFDVCFSNLPNPLFFYNVKITRKTLQFENAYVQVLCNQNNTIFFCYSGVFPKFLDTLEKIIVKKMVNDKAQIIYSPGLPFL